MPGTEARRRRLGPPGLLVIGAAGLVVRLALLAARPQADHLVFVDSSAYLDVATGFPGVLGHASGQLLADSLLRTPGYPAFVWLTGGAHAVWLTVLTQVGMGALVNVWLAHRLAARLVGERAALIAAAVTAFDPSIIGHDLLIATESLATTCLLAGLLLLHELWTRLTTDDRDRAWVAALAAGAVLGAGGLVRPAGAVLPVAAAAALVLTRRQAQAVAMAAAVLALGLLPAAAWTVRNDHVAGTPTLTTAAAYNLLDLGVTAKAADEAGGWRAALDPPRYAGVARRVSAQTVAPLYTHRGPPSAREFDDFATREGRRLVLHHLGTAGVVSGRALVRAWISPGSGVIRSHLPDRSDHVLGPPIALWSFVWIAALDLAACWGTIHALRHRRFALVLWTVGPIVCTMALSLFPALYLRFRVPLVPLAAILAASVLAEVRVRRTSGEQGAGIADAVGIERPLDGDHGVDVGARPSK